jgi:hypothetical protein
VPPVVNVARHASTNNANEMVYRKSYAPQNKSNQRRCPSRCSPVLLRVRLAFGLRLEIPILCFVLS